MAKERITVYLNKVQSEGLKEMMNEDMGNDNVSAFFVHLLSEEKKRREELKSKRNPGRPKKEAEVYEEYTEPDYSDDLPKNILHYGNMIGKREMADIEERTRFHNSQHSG